MTLEPSWRWRGKCQRKHGCELSPCRSHPPSIKHPLHFHWGKVTPNAAGQRHRSVLLHETIPGGRKDQSVWAFPSNGVEIVGKLQRPSQTRNKNYSVSSWLLPCWPRTSCPLCTAVQDVQSYRVKTSVKQVLNLLCQNRMKCSPSPGLGPTSSAVGSGGDWLMRPRLEEGRR